MQAGSVAIHQAVSHTSIAVIASTELYSCSTFAYTSETEKQPIPNRCCRTSGGPAQANSLTPLQAKLLSNEFKRRAPHALAQDLTGPVVLTAMFGRASKSIRQTTTYAEKSQAWFGRAWRLARAPRCAQHVTGPLSKDIESSATIALHLVSRTKQHAGFEQTQDVAGKAAPELFRRLTGASHQWESCIHSKKLSAGPVLGQSISCI